MLLILLEIKLKTLTKILGSIATIIGLLGGIWLGILKFFPTDKKPQPAVVINNYYYNKDNKDVQFASLVDKPQTEHHNSKGKESAAGNVRIKEDLVKARMPNQKTNL
jgi:hypothetical protein